MTASQPSDDELRASDADRERAAEVLQAATADGRVTPAELEERLEQVFAAKSRGELAAVVKDLRPARVAGSGATASRDVGVLGNIERVGAWVVGEQYTGTAVISSGVIDLRGAEFTGPQTTIRVNAWVSTVYVIVPPDVQVEVEGVSILGGFQRDHAADRTGPVTHRVTVTGLAVLGTVKVVRELPPGKRRRRRLAGNRRLEP